MISALEKKYRRCEQCKIDSISHHEKSHQLVPENLLFLAPGEQISINFGLYNNKSMLVIKDRVSGLIWAKVTKNQTTDEAFKAVMEWSYRMGLPHECPSDGGGSFRKRFTQLCKEVGINHILTSAYNSKTNGGCERGIHLIKDCLKRDEV